VTRLREATVPRLEMGWPTPHVVQRTEPLWQEAADEIERLRAELAAMREQRDEARREVCEAEVILSPRDDLTVHEYAAENGWDCYKEGGGA